MTDLEITILCAEAMGYTVGPCEFSAYLPSPSGGAFTPQKYEPLHDDAQAMALVKEFNLEIISPPLRATHKWKVLPVDGENSAVSNDLNRAICECVANMQQAKVPA